MAGNKTDTTDFEAMERAGWADADIAQGYASTFDRATRHVASALAGHVGAGPGQHILDFCTGHGVVASALVAQGAKVTGLDFSPTMIALAKAALPEAAFVEGDAMDMPFGDANFEAATAGFGVPHLPDPSKGMAEVARVMKPGGRLAVSIWRGRGSDGAMGWLFEAVAQEGDPSVRLPPGPDAHALCDADVACGLLEPAGFTDVAVHDIASSLQVPSPEKLFDTFHRGSVRAASLLTHQPDENKSAIRAYLAARVEEQGVASADGWVVPLPSVAVVARRS